jgi:hypothetical protein
LEPKSRYVRDCTDGAVCSRMMTDCGRAKGEARDEEGTEVVGAAADDE